jgi:hypothetical protein
MPYLHIKDFKYGMDRRRPREVGVPGTLWTLQNAVITRGGDIQRAKKFVSAYTLPAGTVGLFSLNQQLYVFGSGSTPAGMPPQVQYVQLAAPNTPTLTRIHDARRLTGRSLSSRNTMTAASTGSTMARGSRTLTPLPRPSPRTLRSPSRSRAKRATTRRPTPAHTATRCC